MSSHLSSIISHYHRIPLIHGMSPQFRNTMEGGDSIQDTQKLHSRSGESTTSDSANIPAPELASIRAPYRGEVSRVTLLRRFDDKIHEWVAPFLAGNFMEQEGPPDNHITISVEMARFYQLITPRFHSGYRRTASEKGQLECDYWKVKSDNQELQQHNWQVQAECHEMKARISFLETEFEQLRVKHSALEEKELAWEHTVACLDKSNSNLREQLDAVERGVMAQGEVTIERCAERKTETTEEEGEGGSRKRKREE